MHEVIKMYKKMQVSEEEVKRLLGNRVGGEYYKDFKKKTLQESLIIFGAMCLMFIFKENQEQPICITEMIVTELTTENMIKQIAEATCLELKNEEAASILEKEKERTAMLLAQSFLGKNGTYL
jgi:hypothetical protein